MIDARITSVALPNGIDRERGVARVSLFLSPRLETDEGDTLDLFEAFLDWPGSLASPGLRYVLQVDAQPEIEARVVGAAPRSELWRALFPPETFVVGRTTDGMVDRAFVTYPVRNVTGYLKERYQAITTEHLTELPPHEAVTARFEALMPVARRHAQGRAGVDQHVAETLAAARAAAAGRRGGETGVVSLSEDAVIAAADLPRGPARDFTQFELFHHRPETPATFEEFEDTAADRRRLVDFHAAVSALGDHPAILRQLGLVVDLEVDAASLPDTPLGRQHLLRALPEFPAGGPAVTVDAPQVAFVNFDGAFRAAGRRAGGIGIGDEFVGGLVRLANGWWELVGVDVDGAAFKALATVASASGRAATAGARQIDDAGEEPLAALRTAGLGLARADTAHHVHRTVAVQHNAGVAGAPARPFFADDVTRGYRLDVLEERTGTWRSLHARRVSYSVPGGPAIALVADEGFLQRGVTQRPPAAGDEPTGSAPLYVHDVLCRWQGWSLAVPRPGKAISRDPRAPHDELPETQPQRVVNEPIADGIQLQASTAIEPGTLPRLRFGESYRVRLRAVDLAGNSVPLREADDVVAGIDGLTLPAADQAEPYHRFEPVGSPELVARAEVREGESLARLVIRSDFDLTPAQWAAAHTGYQAACERHVAPPKVSQLMAEQHGMFDRAIGTGQGVEAAYRAARKEKGKLSDAQVLLSDGSTLTQDAAERDTPAGRYVINREERLVVPYLPDPLAAAVVVAGAPGAQPGVFATASDGDAIAPQFGPPGEPEALVAVPFGSPESWPEVDTFRLRLDEGAGPPRWDTDARVLSLLLPKAGRTRVRLSCQPPPDRLDEFALRRWVVERLAAGGDAAAVELHAAAAAAGRVWSISPGRDVELVHAVQRPVRAPALLRLDARRELGSTSAWLGGEVLVHGASSDRLDLLSAWTDPVDRLNEDGPRAIEASAHVLEVPIHLARDARPGPAEPADPAVVPAGEYDEGRDVVRLLAPPPDDESGRQFLSRHEFGDTRHRLIRYRGVATSRFREYFAPALADKPENVSRSGAVLEMHLPSTARPAVPRVLYVVPTFGWQRGGARGDPQVHVSRRRGGGLRVYLDRPWYSSGADEQLGVVLWPDWANEPPEEMLSFVSRWGRDPIWAAPATPAGPSAEHFPLASGAASGLALEELANTGSDRRVGVVGHVPEYDAARKLWFCDIEIDAGDAYTPFVRLALARFQPHSLKGVELSRVVMAEYAQLAPERSVTIVRNPADAGTVDLSVTGRTFDAGPGGDRGSVTEVTVERRLEDTIGEPGSRLEDTTGELGWTEAVEPGVTVTAGPVDVHETLRWTGQVRVPPGHPPGIYRVAVREYERFEPSPGAAADAARRLVFAETVEI
jgi:hypothetical protein